MGKFDNQVAVITGSADGIGKAVANRLASEGATLALLDINQQQLAKTVKEFLVKGYKAIGFKTNIADEASVERSFTETIKYFKKVDVLVNSAGIVGPTSTKITDYKTSDYDKIYDINLKGAFLVTKYALKIMEQHNYGRIVLIASIAGKEGNPFMCGYSSTKAGVIGLVKGVAKEYAETGITVNGLAPAVIKTPMNDKTSPEQLKYMLSKIPMKRLGTVEEVAAIIEWIVSPDASFTTGFIYDISGGRATY